MSQQFADFLANLKRTRPDGWADPYVKDQAHRKAYAMGVSWQRAQLLTRAVFGDKARTDYKSHEELKRAKGEPFGAERDTSADWLEGKTPVYEEKGIKFSYGNETASKDVEWLWLDRVPFGKLTLLGGLPDLGKSQITLAIAATVTTGGEWPDGKGNTDRGIIIVISSEDDPEDTIKPRLVAAGADMQNVVFIPPMVTVTKTTTVQISTVRRVLNIGADLENLEAVIRRVERERKLPVRLIVLDPLSAYYGSGRDMDSHKDADMRAVLTPIAEWAQSRRLAVLGIVHFKKASEGVALYKMSGSTATPAAARSAYFAIENPETGTKLFLPVKHNLAAEGVRGLEYEIDSRMVLDLKRPTPFIKWKGESQTTITQLMESSGQRNREPEAVNTAMRHLGNYLADGPKTGKQIAELAKACLVSPMTMRRAKEQLNVEQIRPAKVGGPWLFKLPDFTEIVGTGFEDEPDFG